MRHEIVILSGKGGTGKSSLAASFAALAREAVIADCDVDAADLHLVMRPVVRESHEFECGVKASIRSDICTRCGECIRLCRFEAIGEGFTTDPLSCEGCGVCARFCPAGAIAMSPHTAGRWFLSDTPYGPFVHAKLGIAEGNSGKLVSLIKTKAREIAHERNIPMIIVDGPPGVGCPVIASVSGASIALIVTEPTITGFHDLKRAAELTRHFNIPTAVCINRADINAELAEKIASSCSEEGMVVTDSIPYDPDVTAAQIAGQSTVEYSNGAAAHAMRQVWEKIHAIHCLNGLSVKSPHLQKEEPQNQ